MPLIFLVGPRACGKTTVGRTLAQQLGLPFVDTDQYLQHHAGRTVAQIVAAEGWPGFRHRESEALRAVAGLHQTAGAVIATGGGMVLDAQNRAFMRKQGRVFYLSATAEALAARLSDNPLAAQRPSLTGADIKEEVAQVLRERLPLYENAAHYTLDAALSPGRICTAAIALLRGSDGQTTPGGLGKPCAPGKPEAPGGPNEQGAMGGPCKPGKSATATAPAAPSASAAPGAPPNSNNSGQTRATNGKPTGE